MEIQYYMYIRGFHVYRATVVFSSCVYFLYGPLLFISLYSTNSVTYLLAASIQEEGILLDKGPWGLGRHRHLFVFFTIN